MNPVVREAKAFSREKHEGQVRKGVAGEPYIEHLAEVAVLVEAAGGDDVAVAAAWLHDVIEDCGVSITDLTARFGSDVADVVVEVSDNKKLAKEERKRLQIATASRKSPRAAMVATADKTSNLRSIANSPPSDWTPGRKRAYAAWADAVVLGLPRLPAGLRAAFRSARDAVARPDLPVTLCATWDDGAVEVVLTVSPRAWRSIVKGRPLVRTGEGYGYEGDWFVDRWYFEGGIEGEVEITYGDDGGVGYIGPVKDLIIDDA